MKRRRAPTRRERGVALILVIVAIMITTLIFEEFKTRTTYDKYGADNARDHMRAEMLARSSMNLSELLIRLQQVLDNPDVKQQIGEVQLTDWADMFMSAFGGTAQEVADTTGLAGDDAKGFGAEIGSFGVTITSDDGRINLNCANSRREHKQLVYTLLDALYYFPAFDPLFQDPDADGWRRDRRLQTQAIVDYIDEDRTQAVPAEEPPSTAGEDYGYESIKDSYKAKNDYLDTLDEAKLIRGIDDRFWTIFGPSLTVYGGCQLNIKSLKDPRIIAAILYLTAKNREDPVIRDGNRLWYHALAVSYARENGYPFADVNAFVEFVKDPEAQLGQGLAGMLGGAAGSGGDAAASATPVPVQIPGVPPGTDLGLELDPAQVGKVLRAGPQRTYRVEAWGQVDRHVVLGPPLMTKLTAVWDMGNVNSNQRSTDAKARNGAWVYIHVE